MQRDTDDPQVLLELVDRLSRRVARGLSGPGVCGKTVKVKLRLADFTTFTRQVTLSEPVDSAEAIAEAAAALTRNEMRPGRMFRLVGVGVAGLEDKQPAPLQPRLAGFD